MANNITSFSIAHYILLISMVVACGGIVAYAIMHDTGNAIVNPITANDDSASPNESTTISACQQDVTNAVAQMWAHNPTAVPVKYRDIAMAYYTGPVDTTFHGECNGTSFVCNAGTQRMNCDPCAGSNARDYAMGIHTQDMLEKHCSE